jgi:hypothetical protein
MLLEAVLKWLLAIPQFMISLLPANGSTFSNFPASASSFLKTARVLNGYAPISEMVTMLGIVLLIVALEMIWRAIMFVFNLITKIIP